MNNYPNNVLISGRWASTPVVEEYGTEAEVATRDNNNRLIARNKALAEKYFSEEIEEGKRFFHGVQLFCSPDGFCVGCGEYGNLIAAKITESAQQDDSTFYVEYARNDEFGKKYVADPLANAKCQTGMVSRQRFAGEGAPLTS